MVGGTSVGAIICCDTKVTAGGKTISVLAAKRRPVSQNVMVCYTSDNFFVTTTALNYSVNRRVCLKRLGDNLRFHHRRWGGLTELLGVVWHRDRLSPQILEVMPDAYEPRPRSGIVGIGDRAVLERFRELLTGHLESSTQISHTPESIAGLSKAVGSQLNPDWSSALLNGATVLAAALRDSINQVGGPTVGLPLVVNIILPKSGVQSVQVVMISTSGGEIGWATEGDRLVTLPSNPPTRTRQWVGNRSALQLLSWPDKV